MAGESCTWGAWQPYTPAEGVTPYFDWSETGSGDDRVEVLDKHTNADALVLAQPAGAQQVGHPPSNGQGNWVFAGLGEHMPVPRFAVNENPASLPEGATLPRKKIAAGRRKDSDLPMVLDATVIAGVIDVGMPLGHDRWRLKNGRTRVLSAWQMMAPWSLKEDSNLPFGAEFHQNDINKLLAKHSGGSLKGHLDEEAFNIETGVLNYALARAQRDVAGGTSHGAHVLDVVAGLDRHARDQRDFRDLVRIIAVNAPSSATFGAAGTFFNGYMFHAIKRIADMADKIWADGRTKAQQDAFFKEKGHRGFPIVINMSFGKQAGSKDLLDQFPWELKKFLEYREKMCLSKVHFVMPVGNDNQERCNAFLEPEKDAPATLQWRHMPQDHTSNFAEVWSDPGKAANGTAVADVRLVAPCGAQSPHVPMNDGTSRFCDLHTAKGDIIGRIYLEYRTLPGEPEPQKARYTLCVAATHAIDPDKPCAPSGMWKIIAANPTDQADLQYVASIQTDQALTLGGGRNLRSYFDDPNYERFDNDTGRLVDTYLYDPHTGKYENTDLRAADSPVRRHGTINASAATTQVARVAGFRASDGKHDPYSSSGRESAKGQDGGTSGYPRFANAAPHTPTASLPTDDGPAHFGILAAGAHAGSVRAMQGTSFASSQASRTVINALLNGTFKDSASATLTAAAQAREKTCPYPFAWQPTVSATLGAGRLPNPNPRTLSRMGRE